MTTNRKRPEKEKPKDRTSEDDQRSETTGRKVEVAPDTEHRYQKRAQDPDPDQDTEDDKRYMTRLKPSDYKPSSYLWGYKNPAAGDEERKGSGTVDPNDHGQGESGASEQRSIDDENGRDLGPASGGETEEK